MATVSNRSIRLFGNQISNATGESRQVLPSLTQGLDRVCELELSGVLGGGIVSLEISFSTTGFFVPWLLDGVPFQQNQLGYGKRIIIKTPFLVRAILAGATNPNLTVTLYYKDRSGDNLPEEESK